MSRIPLSILTGFLGSGKTTLLQRLLSDPRLRDVAVIINELGEIGIDHLLVREVAEDVVLLPSGCLCCVTRRDLVATLRDLYHRRSTHAIPRFGRILVETTGLADPGPILQTVAKDPLIAQHFALDGTIVTIDAVHGMQQLDRYRESIMQVAFADRLVITKADLASAGALTALAARLAQINSSAPIMRAVHGRMDAGAVLDAGLYNRATGLPDVGRWLRVAPMHARSSRYRGIHDDGVRSFALVFDHPLDWEPFAEALQSFIADHAPDVLRVKGILNVASEPRPVVVHGVHHLFYPPQCLTCWPSEDRCSRLVFITSRVERESVERALREHGHSARPLCGKVSKNSRSVSTPLQS